MRFAPALCSRRQMAAPTRFAPPVIKMTFPCKSCAPALDFGPPRGNLAQRTQTMRTRLTDALPEPDKAARAHSAKVLAAVHAAIEAAGGWIPFERYMNLVLYAPGLGYYAAGARKFGAQGDFVTAPEMTPLF